ncbi:heme exporter protein CcmB [Maribrevibacterium harenarium]|uniref:Heme exporter protein B n=1 Tax=Maribrevibacterium harenarium TaxID=2589817 RepID=A0A501X2M1_9GAMM|nr:heme exporter protein CcmB [Maribrevibacterium harenarium]TPE54729.1 heme exporter protein CcmB [Maribrevibacterium harenarium]
MTLSSFFKAELLTLFRRKQSIFNALIFFVMVVTLFPLGVDPSPDFLAPAAGGIIWCAIALAILMSVESLFKEDYNDGSLEQWLVSGHSVSVLVLLKVFAQWLMVVIPLVLALPFLSKMLFLASELIPVMLVSVLVGSPALFLIGAIGAALTVSLRGGAVLMLLLILPLYIPVIIFATGAVRAAQLEMPFTGQLAILGAISLLALAISPLMAAISIKASVS